MVTRIVLAAICTMLLAACIHAQGDYRDPLPGPAQTTVTHPVP